MPDTERAVYVQRVDPDHRQEYIDIHDEVPEGVTDAMARGGVTDFELYLRDDIAVCVLEAEDLDIEEWERHTAHLKREGVDVDADPEEQIPFMDRIWSFSPGDGEVE